LVVSAVTFIVKALVAVCEPSLTCSVKL